MILSILLSFFVSAQANSNALKLNYIEAEKALKAFDEELALAVRDHRQNFLAQSKFYPRLLQLKAQRDQLQNPEKEPSSIFSEPQIKAEMELTTKIFPSPGPSGNMFGKDFPQNTFALTFDDGPSERYTIPIINLLQSHRKKATFFWLAENVQRSPSIVSQVGAADMPRENHSFTHAQLPKLGADALAHEIIDSQTVLTSAYGEAPKFFRCPYGAGLNVAPIRQMIADQKMIHVYWTIDSLDWQDKDPNSVFTRVKNQMTLEKRGIILFHDIHPQSVDAAELVLKYSDSLENTHGRLRLVTIPEIVDEINRRP